MEMTPAQAYVAFQIGYWDAANVIGWAVTIVAGDPNLWGDPDFAELAGLNPNGIRDGDNVGAHLTSFVERALPEFAASQEEAFAKQLFCARLEEYLANTCTPDQVCRMVTAIENLFDFPDWLGNMYNACDWIEPDTNPVDCRHLEAEVADRLKQLKA